MEEKSIRFSTGKRNVSFFTQVIRAGSGVHAGPCQFDSGTLFPEIKMPGREGILSSPFNAEVKNQ
jgi:hypothetical protein